MTNAANTAGWVTRGRHQFSRLFGRFHHGDQQVLHANIQIALDQHRIAGRRTYHRVALIGAQRLQLSKQARYIVRSMLGVKQQPVKACRGGNLRGVGARQAEPNPRLGLPRQQLLLKRVVQHFHSLSFYINTP